ncbi:IL15 protein, partial [Zapornia atra]|nr:IL15 protein [Zapornia atra]
QKTHLKSICLQYQLYLLLKSLSKNEMGLIIFFLCAYVPKTGGAAHCKWAEVLKDLEQIKASKDIDVILYTANTDEDNECQEPVIRCFFLETKVIFEECRIKQCSKTQDVWNIWKNGIASLENNKLNSTTSAKCKECEEYEEKNFSEFIQSFVKVIQKDCK